MGRSSSSKPAWKIAGYAADKLIGYGATSQVWQGRVLRTGEPVALKVLAVTDAAAHRSARAEAALLSALDHPHLLRLHELVSDGNQAILVVDYAAGGSLAQLLERRSRITVGELVTAVAPVAAAVAYLHEEGLVHGDISPANLLFTAQGQPVLADLGVASMCGNTDDPHATLAYLDPAVANGGAAGTPSDVFMLAATALHALTGRPPWIASTSQSLVDVAALGDIAGLDDALAGVPAEVAAVVRRGLSALPHARGTAAEFALDLRHAATPAPLELAAGQLRAVGTDAGDADADADGNHGAPHSAEVAYQPRHGAASASAVDWSARPPRAARRRSAIATDLRLERPDFARPDFARPEVFDVDARRAQDRFGQASIERTGRNDRADRTDRADQADQADRADRADRAAAMSLTHQVRARVRSAPPPAPSRQRTGLRRWLVGGAGLSVAAACAGTVLVTGWRPPVLGGAAHGPSSSAKSPTATTAPAALPSATLPTTTTAAAATSPPVIPPEPRATSTISAQAKVPAEATATSTATPSTAAGVVDWQVVLADLDVHREHAFATANPSELAQVYIAGPLRSQDAAVLRRALRPGCTATGLRTRYRVLRSQVNRDGAVVTAAASLAAGVLRCPAAASQHTAPVPASTLTIQLVDTSAGYRIAGLQQSAQR